MVGTALLAVSISIFLEPLAIVTGGVSGLGIIIRSVVYEHFGRDIPIWLTNTVLNVPLFMLAMKARGWRFIARTGYATLGLSACLFVTDMLVPVVLPRLGEIDYLLGAVFGAVFAGVGLGLVFRFNATTGGSDLAASIINKYIPTVSIGKGIFIVDAAVILTGLFVFGPVKAMYAIISVFIAARIIEAVLEGLKFAKAAFIISDRGEEIGEVLMKELNRGATALHGQGMFTKDVKNVVLCVVSKKEIVKLKRIVHTVDNNAFVIVAEVREVLGEGFGLNEG
jgi:uncharacterized membrane-anchored protein YitT (DUF2179 family)